MLALVGLVHVVLVGACVVLGVFIGVVALVFLWPALWVAVTVRADYGKHGWLAFFGTLTVCLLLFHFLRPWPGYMSWVWFLWPPGYCWRQARVRRRRALRAAAERQAARTAALLDPGEQEPAPAPLARIPMKPQAGRKNTRRLPSKVQVRRW